MQLLWQIIQRTWRGGEQRARLLWPRTPTSHSFSTCLVSRRHQPPHPRAAAYKPNIRTMPYRLQRHLISPGVQPPEGIPTVYRVLQCSGRRRAQALLVHGLAVSTVHKPQRLPRGSRWACADQFVGQGPPRPPQASGLRHRMLF